MNTKEMMASIVTAMLVVGVFVVMIGPAAAIDYNVGKSTLTEPGGTVNNSLEYDSGQQVNYSMSFKPTSENCSITYAKDIFPDGTEEDLAPGSYPILLNKNQLIEWETTWVVNGAGVVNGKIVNYLKIEGYDGYDNYFEALAPKSSNIRVTVSFTYAATDCMVVTVTPDYSGPVAWHQWIINGVPGSVVNTVPVPMTLTSCGTKSVTLKGGPDPGDLDNYEAFTDTIDVACEPVVKAERTPTGCVEIGDSVTFSGSITSPGTPPYSYLWTFTNGLASSSSSTVTHTIPAGGTIATFTVTDDLGCSDTDSVSVSICSPPHEPPSDVPILTPTGMVALIGMLCIVGAGRILTKGRRS